MATALTSPQTIALKGPMVPMERLANAALSPGNLLTLNSSNKFIKQTGVGVKVPTIFAGEQDYGAKEITVAYASGDTVKGFVAGPGAEVYARIPASAAAIVIGDLLESDGTGCLRKMAGALTDSSGGTANTTLQDISASPTEAEIANNFADVAAQINKVGAIAMALEAVDNSGGGSETFIRVQIL